ncbi:hypothetical protein F4779DRAFT_583412 [Xylariaceae sp. FL0662B]|nr:hypothetical protein F4779DRAFT_583412 [Xylariaceae sp. FL0662B]
MSMVHILAIPRAGIFNGVSLNPGPESVDIIDEMIRLFRRSWSRGEFREVVLAHQRAAIMGRYKEEPDDNAYRLATKHYETLELMADNLKLEHFAFGLHLWPDHSVGHLHLHIIAMPYECRKYSTSRHDVKTKDALEVRDFIKSRPVVETEL